MHVPMNVLSVSVMDMAIGIGSVDPTPHMHAFLKVSCDIHSRTPDKHSSTNFLLYSFLPRKCSTNRLWHGHGCECHSPVWVPAKGKKRAGPNKKTHFYIREIEEMINRRFTNPPFRRAQGKKRAGPNKNAYDINNSYYE